MHLAAHGLFRPELYASRLMAGGVLHAARQIRSAAPPSGSEHRPASCGPQGDQEPQKGSEGSATQGTFITRRAAFHWGVLKHLHPLAFQDQNSPAAAAPVDGLTQPSLPFRSMRWALLHGSGGQGSWEAAMSDTAGYTAMAGSAQSAGGSLEAKPTAGQGLKHGAAARQCLEDLISALRALLTGSDRTSTTSDQHNLDDGSGSAPMEVDTTSGSMGSSMPPPAGLVFQQISSSKPWVRRVLANVVCQEVSCAFTACGLSAPDLRSPQASAAAAVATREAACKRALLVGGSDGSSSSSGAEQDPLAPSSPPLTRDQSVQRTYTAEEAVRVVQGQPAATGVEGPLGGRAGNHAAIPATAASSLTAAMAHGQPGTDGVQGKAQGPAAGGGRHGGSSGGSSDRDRRQMGDAWLIRCVQCLDACGAHSEAVALLLHLLESVLQQQLVASARSRSNSPPTDDAAAAADGKQLEQVLRALGLSVGAVTACVLSLHTR